MLMKKRLLSVLVLLSMFGVFSSVAAENYIIAVFDFKSVSLHESREGRIFSLLLFAELSNYDSVKMVERKRLEKILQEKRLNRSSLVGRKYMELAALVNADYIVTGRIYKDEDERKIVVNLKLTKCSDGKIFGKTFSVPFKEKDESLERIAKQAAAFIAKSFDRKAKTQTSSRN